MGAVKQEQGSFIIEFYKYCLLDLYIENLHKLQEKTWILPQNQAFPKDLIKTIRNIVNSPKVRSQRICPRFVYKTLKKSVTKFQSKLLVIGNGNFNWILNTTFGWLSQSESRKRVQTIDLTPLKKAKTLRPKRRECKKTLFSEYLRKPKVAFTIQSKF